MRRSKISEILSWRMNFFLQRSIPMTGGEGGGVLQRLSNMGRICWASMELLWWDATYSVSPEDEHVSVTASPVFVCGWGREWQAGSLACSQLLTQFYRVFLCGRGGVFKPACCRPTNTSASRHRGDHKDFSVWNTVGLWRWVFVVGEEVGVELTPNDLHVQSGGTGLIFWATRQM